MNGHVREQDSPERSRIVHKHWRGTEWLGAYLDPVILGSQWWGVWDYSCLHLLAVDLYYWVALIRAVCTCLELCLFHSHASASLHSGTGSPHSHLSKLPLPETWPELQKPKSRICKAKISRKQYSVNRLCKKRHVGLCSWVQGYCVYMKTKKGHEITTWYPKTDG